MDLYDAGDQQETQFRRTYEIALKHLAEMESKRDELIETIDELKEQLEWGRQVIAQFEKDTNAT